MMKRLVCRGFLSSPAAIRSDGEFGQAHLQSNGCVRLPRKRTLIHVVADRLHKLRERRYLASVARFMQKQVYGIGSKSVPFLIEQGYAPSDLADNRLRRHELTEIGIRHSLFVADIHARTIALTRSGPAELVLRQEGRLPWDSVSARKGDPEIPVRTDAYFVLKQIARPDRRNHVHVFLEADRSTMAHSRIAAKIAGYLAYYEQGRHARKYPGMQAFIVATVTQTRSRAPPAARHIRSSRSMTSRSHRCYPRQIRSREEFSFG